MRQLFLVNIRLSWYFFGFFALYLVVAYSVKGIVFDSGALTLFSINSFLYGFYIGPVLGSQRARIEELGKTIRAETSSLFGMLLKTKKLGPNHNKVQVMFSDYMNAVLKERKAAAGEEQYEALITYCLERKDDEKFNNLLLDLVDNQKNRSNLALLMNAKVYSNEWWIMLVLFSVTLSFVLFLDFGSLWIMGVVKALMCTGLTMLMINLLKLSTLSHKKAKDIWNPLKKLLETRFYRFD